MRLSSHSTAAALATNVFPVPGGPYSKIPVRNRMGQLANNFGDCKKNHHRRILALVLHLVQCGKKMDGFIKKGAPLSH